MCIIIAKTKTQKAPAIEILENCFENNPDGAGFMYVNNGRVIIDKGYMTKKDFLTRYKQLLQKYSNFENKNLIIHCRISTSGRITKEFCHPYIISTDFEKMKKIKLKCNIALAHNGVLTDYAPQDRKTNDTMQFIKKYIFRKYKQRQLFKQKTIAEIKATGSKFAILTRRDNLLLIGNFKKYGGNYYSNDSYYAYKSRYNTYDNYFYNINENDFVLIDNYECVRVKDLRTEKNSKFFYDFSTGKLYEYTKYEIINVIDFVEIL